MSWSSPTTPNLPDYLSFLQYNMMISQWFLPSIVPAPAAPGLTAASSGGSLPTETVFVVTTYVTLYGETTPSPQAAAAVTGPSGQVTVASPPLIPGATGYNVYAANAIGAEVLQPAGPTAIGTAYTISSLTTGSVVPPTANTAGSPWPSYAFDRALGLVLSFPYRRWQGTPPAGGFEYTWAVYNCAGHIQIRITPDQPGRAAEEGSFTRLRDHFKLLTQSNGLIAANSDNGTSSTIAVSDSMKQLTLTDLDFMKTDWGRTFMAFNQDYGPTIWAIS